MFDLRTKTSKSWLACVFADFDSFVIDHTLCERKASAMGMSLVAKYPDRIEILDPLIEFAREELEHFHIMFRVMLERGLTFTEDTKDSYVNALRELSKGSRGDDLLLDRFLIPGIVEARGCERLQLVTEAIEPGPLKDIYLDITRAEARHRALFYRLAREYFPNDAIDARADFLLDREAEILERLPEHPRVH
jgi:tRNA-(ms[2]io[6]A)-hydroxylase